MRSEGLVVDIIFTRLTRLKEELRYSPCLNVDGGSGATSVREFAIHLHDAGLPLRGTEGILRMVLVDCWFQAVSPVNSSIGRQRS